MTDPNDDVDTGRPRGVLPREEISGDLPASLRLTFTYDADGVRLSSRQRVTMLAPPDDSPRTFAARAGWWVELRDAEGHGVYRQVLIDPMPSTWEVHTPLAGGRPTVVPAAVGESGVFQAVVPDLPEAEDVVLHGLRDQPTAVPLLTEPLRPAEES